MVVVVVVAGRGGVIRASVDLQAQQMSREIAPNLQLKI